MSKRFFNKNIKKSCLLCLYGNKSNYVNEIFCIKRGVTTSEDYCRKYKYDPLKRIPDGQKISDEYDNDDFLL